jgi:hypothetical protein
MLGLVLMLFCVIWFFIFCWLLSFCCVDIRFCFVLSLKPYSLTVTLYILLFNAPLNGTCAILLQLETGGRAIQRMRLTMPFMSERHLRHCLMRWVAGLLNCRGDAKRLSILGESLSRKMPLCHKTGYYEWTGTCALLLHVTNMRMDLWKLQ